MKEENLLPQVNFGVTKAEITDMVNLVVAQLSDGENYMTDKALQIAENLSAMMEFSETLKKDDRFRRLVRDMVDRYGKEYVSSSGAKIVKFEAGTKYDYSTYPKWVELENQIAPLRAAQKVIEEKMKVIPQGTVLVDPETGDSIPAPLKTSTPTFSVKLKTK